MKDPGFFKEGFRAMLPITTGAIPFGAVVGTICAEAGFSFTQSEFVNLILYAGTSHLASAELMMKHAASAVVIITGLIINLRFLLYSAALSPVLQNAGFWTKAFCTHSLTDQSYAVMIANQERLKTPRDMIQFYCGTAVCMWLAWHASFIAGYVFGNFAPASWALDYGVPLSFVALVIPTLKNGQYVTIAAFSCVASVLLHDLPYHTGLMVTALSAIALAALITRKRGVA